MSKKRILLVLLAIVTLDRIAVALTIYGYKRSDCITLYERPGAIIQQCGD